jgi:hypothetical protein
MNNKRKKKEKKFPVHVCYLLGCYPKNNGKHLKGFKQGGQNHDHILKSITLAAVPRLC